MISLAFKKRGMLTAIVIVSAATFVSSSFGLIDCFEKCYPCWDTELYWQGEGRLCWRYLNGEESCYVCGPNSPGQGYCASPRTDNCQDDDLHIYYKRCTYCGAWCRNQYGIQLYQGNCGVNLEDDELGPETRYVCVSK